jgi:hypothetical protein
MLPIWLRPPPGAKRLILKIGTETLKKRKSGVYDLKACPG